MIKVQPLQSIRLFGWLDQPREIVTWDDLAQKNLSWRKLRIDYGFSAAQLHALQPDKQVWLERGNIRHEDAPDMICFPVNPILDLNMDLGELWKMRWPVDTLIKLGITYEQLLCCGLTPNIMVFFNFSLASWHKLGFRHKHAVSLNPGQSFKNFGMPHKELLAILHSFDAPGLPAAAENS